MEQAARLATALQLAVKALQFYTADHPRVVEAIAHLDEACNAILAQHPRLTITAGKENLLVDGEPFLHPPTQVKTLAADLERRQLGGLIFTAGTTRRELLEVVRLLSMRPEQIKTGGGAEEILKRAEVLHVRVSRVRYEAVTEGEKVVWANSVQTLAEGQMPTPEEMRALFESAANNDEQLTLLRERLVELGVTREQLDELLEHLNWDRLSLDERIDRLSDGRRIFDLEPPKLQHFIREVLDAGRAADAHALLEHYVIGLAHDSDKLRQQVCDGLAQVVTMQLPRDTEHLVGTAVLNHFVRTADAPSAEAAANLLAMLVATGRSERALRVFEKLETAGAAAAQALARALGERAAPIVSEVCSADPETLAKTVMPLVARLGGAIAPHIIEALSNEEDRNRRGRLVKALKAIGEPAYPAVIDALRSQTWFVVRNALNVLGDIGTPEHVDAIGRKLEHSDPRVRRAAARALSKIGGAEAEALLVAAINDRDAETQAEVLLCLGAMKAQTAVPALLEILKPKRFFARDTPALRSAAEKALSAIRGR